MKSQIRKATEEEEYLTYTERMSDEWRLALAKLGTDWIKEQITDDPVGMHLTGGINLAADR